MLEILVMKNISLLLSVSGWYRTNICYTIIKDVLRMYNYIKGVVTSYGPNYISLEKLMIQSIFYNYNWRYKDIIFNENDYANLRVVFSHSYW